MKNLILLISVFTSNLLLARVDIPARSIASVPTQIRVEHAKELLGKGYSKSLVSKFEDKENLHLNILATVKKSLPKAYKRDAARIAKTIISESVKHSLDPYFVMAVISGESSFNPLAKGPVGEIGLMQLRPGTGEWMAKKAKIKWRGNRTLLNPISNIKLGTEYLSWLRTKFANQSQLYLAAYNMGPKSVRRALAKSIRPKDYPIHVMKRYIAYYKTMETI